MQTTRLLNSMGCIKFKGNGGTDGRTDTQSDRHTDRHTDTHRHD